MAAKDAKKRFGQLMDSIRGAINEARKEYSEGRAMPFDREAVKDIAAIGRQRLLERDR
jgi:hypothetical protein